MEEGAAGAKCRCGRVCVWKTIGGGCWELVASLTIAHASRGEGESVSKNEKEKEREKGEY